MKMTAVVNTLMMIMMMIVKNGRIFNACEMSDTDTFLLVYEKFVAI